MKQFRFKKIDAFVNNTSYGNPAGYIFIDNENISTAEMQIIAKELKGLVNEVGFVKQHEVNELELKFFSATQEVDFCGHATVAILYDMIKNQEALKAFDFINIWTNKGKSRVENRLNEENAVFVWSPKPVEIECNLSYLTVSEALEIDIDHIETALPLKIINAGLSTLIVPVASLEAIINLAPAIARLHDFCLRTGIDIIEVFTNEVADQENDYRVRVFAPKFGYLEDPATGSGNAALGYYLLEDNIWQKGILKIEQNDSLRNYNSIKLTLKVDEESCQRVLFGGQAVTRIEGVYNLY
jgi:PhzF family phenazine biosynthesis protein